MIKNNNYKAVLVYTGYNENSVVHAESVQASDVEVAMNLLLERDKRNNEECFEEFQEFEQYMNDFFGHGRVINGVGVSEAGEENCWIVLPEGHKFYDLVSIDSEEWSNEQWDQWLEFMDKETQE
jgi:hypothetical protein